MCRTIKKIPSAYVVSKPEIPVKVWTLVKGTRHARCVVVDHPVGSELRCFVDDAPILSHAFNGDGAWKVEASAWLEAFGATGWRSEDPR